MNDSQTILIGATESTAAKPDGSNAVIVLALALLAAGVGLAVSGVNILFGAGWALLTAAPAPIFLAAVLIRGVKRGS